MSVPSRHDLAAESLKPMMTSRSGSDSKAVPDPCTVVRGNPHPGRGTVLVLGVPRGGTSVVAGLCHLLGVPMGLNIDPSNMEDRAFRALRHDSDRIRKAGEFFEHLRNDRDLAGVKDPALADWITECYPQVPEPVLVLVTRDVYATAQREECAGSDLFASLEEAVRRKYALFDFVKPLDSPLMSISYERLLVTPLPAVRSLAQFLVGDVDEQILARAADLVRPHADMPYEVNFLIARQNYEREESSYAASGRF